MERVRHFLSERVIGSVFDSALSGAGGISPLSTTASGESAHIQSVKVDCRRMNWKILRATAPSAIALATAADAGVAASSDANAVVSYPEELHGFWIPASAACPQTGQSFDGDSAMHISAQFLQGYEDQSKPSAVELVSSEPLAWRIGSKMDVGPSGIYERGDPKIFVLGEGGLTVASEFHADIYRKCD